MSKYESCQLCYLVGIMYSTYLSYIYTIEMARKRNQVICRLPQFSVSYCFCMYVFFFCTFIRKYNITVMHTLDAIDMRNIGLNRREYRYIHYYTQDYFLRKRLKHVYPKMTDGTKAITYFFACLYLPISR